MGEWRRCSRRNTPRGDRLRCMTDPFQDVHRLSRCARRDHRPAGLVGSGRTSCCACLGLDPARRAGRVDGRRLASAGRSGHPGRPRVAPRAQVRGCGWMEHGPQHPIADLPVPARPVHRSASERQEATRHLGRSRPGRTRPNARRGSSPGATSRRRSWPAGCCAPAVSCCWTNRPGVSTSAPARRSIG